MWSKNKIKSAIRAIIALVAVAISAGITGCGSGSGAASTPTPTPAPTPAITSISPSGATVGGPAFTLTVNGSNFVPASQVAWNGSTRTTTVVSSSHLQAHIQAADVAVAGKVAITVVNPTPGGGSSNSVNFTVPPATITFQSTGALDGSDAANTNNAVNVWTVNPDGTGATPLTKYTLAIASNPVWSPNGSKVAFSGNGALDGSNAAGIGNNIWVVNADGSGATPLTRIAHLNLFGQSNIAWSPDGTKIAFDSSRALDGRDASNTNNGLNIWVMNADGSGALPLTDITVTETISKPIWSPDGSKIAYLSDRALTGFNLEGPNSTLNIWVMNSDGSGGTGLQGSGSTPLTKLTALGAGVDPGSAVWSPDSSKIIFSSRRALDGSDAKGPNGTDNIWVVNADGSSDTPLIKLTAIGAGSSSPAWSPDGSKVAFVSVAALDGSDAQSINNSGNIWVMNADGSGRTPVTKLIANFSSENVIWSPGGKKILFDSTRAVDGSDAANSNATTLNIWVVNADGSGATPLTKRTAAGASSFSPKLP